MKSLDKNELKELLVRCWMTHDGLWFYHSLQECGIEKTSKINQAAARAIGAVEARRITRALGIEKVETFEEFKELGLVGVQIIPYFFESCVSAANGRFAHIIEQSNG